MIVRAAAGPGPTPRHAHHSTYPGNPVPARPIRDRVERNRRRAHRLPNVRFAEYVTVITPVRRSPTANEVGGDGPPSRDLSAPHRSHSPKVVPISHCVHTLGPAPRIRSEGGPHGQDPQRSQSASRHETGGRRQGADGPRTSHGGTKAHRSRAQRDAPPAPPSRRHRVGPWPSKPVAVLVFFSSGALGSHPDRVRKNAGRRIVPRRPVRIRQ